ncbi:hypothetical protein NOF04DRAFT_1321582 [Fusarium oxysporum II5]|uniref:Magnesium transport protein CorA n=1 Tax=Fusarium oxysporum f. sp. cubense TaxID=61366 RepID=A0A5C6ST11_FUSOC|nr:hypothetical protein NOF04DRAFT_1321582 [Fusarium oxysporum II5]TXC01566.1 hypothetical protein FocTR4_00008029 [Fusarium oxysporum f. sp. cubense]
MFESDRQELLESSLWKPLDKCLGYIEAGDYYDAEGTTRSPYYKRDYLPDTEVEDWLSQSGRFATDARCSLRVLMCERLDFERLGFAMSKRSFLSAETTFGLPPEALPILNLHRGQYYSNIMWNDADDNESMSSIAVTIKVPQMMELGNFGLSLTHILKSGTTMALIHGWNMWTNTLPNGNRVEPHHMKIEKLIKSTHSLWTHPLLLPLVFLREHLSRADMQSSKLSREVQTIERNLGIERTGRLAMIDIGVTDQMKQLFGQEEKRTGLMSELTSASTDVSNVTRVLKWDKECIQFLHQVKGQIDKCHGRSAIALDSELSSLIQFMYCHVESAGNFTGFLHSRLETELNVLYNLIAHTNAELNLRIASTTGLDSAAMKTLTFVTIAFLPATFIATLFSMPMFDWESDGKETISPNFWIYWVVSIPLTLITAGGWRVWWHYQKIYHASMFKTGD